MAYMPQVKVINYLYYPKCWKPLFDLNYYMVRIKYYCSMSYYINCTANQSV